MDINTFSTVKRSNEGVELELKRLDNGKGSGSFITIKGRDSDEFRAIRSERAAQMVARLAEGKPEEFPQDEEDAMVADTLSKLTVSWRGIDRNGQPLPFDRKTAYEVYLAMPAIREQLNSFVANRANFSGA